MTSIDNWKKGSVWLLCLPIAAMVLILNVQYVLNHPFSFVDYGLLLVLAIAVVYFPIRTLDSFFSLISGVSLATFVIYGLFPEMFLSSVAILVLLIRSNIKLDQHYRYPLNLLAVNLLSIVSAAAYNVTIELFEISNLEALGILPISVYLSVYVLGNQLLACLTEKYFYGYDDVQFFDKKLVFSLKTNLLNIPLSFILIYLYYEMGTLGIIVGALPFVTTTVVSKYYYKSKHNNILLTEITHYSQKLAAKGNCKAVIHSFIDYILAFFPSERIYYFKITQEKFAVLDRIYAYEKPPQKPEDEMVLMEDSKIMDAFKTQTPAAYSKASEWQSFSYFNQEYQPESAIVLPIKVFGQKRGMIVVTHSNRAVYDNFLITLLVIFYQFFKVVLDNAYQYEQLEGSNVTDYLTDLPNLRGFSKYFENLSEKGDFESLSVIVMDLDRFKDVNDRHGHEAGNEVLVQIADVLRGFTGEDCFIARFGGEEFIILLKDFSKEDAYLFAEDIRKTIEKNSYSIPYSIETEGEVTVQCTASLGLATFPNDAKNIQDLIKLADRAMYLGSKQNGRNLVTVHSSESQQVQK